MDKQIVVHPYDEIVFGNKEEWTTDTYNSIENIKIIMQNERSKTKNTSISFDLYKILENANKSVVTEDKSAIVYA